MKLNYKAEKNTNFKIWQKCKTDEYRFKYNTTKKDAKDMVARSRTVTDKFLYSNFETGKNS